ncbi:MAG: DUF2264 domain-containing protein [Planctomycetota bacterium]
MTDQKLEFASYDWFIAQAEALIAPLAALMNPGESTLPIEGPASDHGDNADKLEAVARPMLLIALWLNADRSSSRADGVDVGAVALWCRGAIELGTNPASDRYWGPLSNYHQHAVEMAILVMAMRIAEHDLWTPLSDDAKANTAAWLGQIRGHAGHRNNHLFFDVLVLEFLKHIGHERLGDDAAIDHLFMHLESMHLGHGWFIDGGNETFDHYNAYAFHTYGLYWAHFHGDRDPARAERWKSWAASFVRDYAHCFAASGEPIPYGRSLTYRFNGVGVFALAPLCGLATIPSGQARELIARCINYFTSNDITQSQGCMSVGWSNQFDAMREPYTCAGSPYWAAKGFMPLLLGKDHPFFTDPAVPPPAESGFVRTIETPAWVLRSVHGGEVELLPAGNICAFSSANRFGSYRWGRVAYRTGIGTLTSPDPTNNPTTWPADGGLRIRATRDPREFGRLYSIPNRVTERDLRSQFALGMKDIELHVNVEQTVRWHGDWLLVTIRADAHEPVTLSFGGFALGGDGPFTNVDAGGEPTTYAAVTGNERTSAIQAVTGFDIASITREGTDAGRQHLYGPRHAVPEVMTDTDTHGRISLAVLLCTTNDPAHAQPWRVTTASEDVIALEHPTLGDWTIANPYD